MATSPKEKSAIRILSKFENTEIIVSKKPDPESLRKPKSPLKKIKIITILYNNTQSVNLQKLSVML